MARYKDVNYDQNKLNPVSFGEQIQPGTFAYTQSYLIHDDLDLNLFDARYGNGDTGAPAFAPAVLLKILYAYSRGITSSCKIRQARRENIIFMALSADSQPHFTTIADSDRCWRSGSYRCCALY
jgi:transposase